jgi:hypothetical protein
MKVSGLGSNLQIVEAGHLVRGRNVAVPTALTATPAPCLLSVEVENEGTKRRAVYAYPRQEMNPSGLAISLELAAELGLRAGVKASWQVATEGFRREVFKSLTLELVTEQSIESALIALSKSDALLELMIEVDPSNRSTERSVNLCGMTFRLTRSEPSVEDGPAVFTVDHQTAVSLYAPGTKCGVDMVILADCSGSMGIADLTVSAESAFARLGVFGRSTQITRSEALHRALKKLLDLRLTLAGRISRIALVAFTEQCRQRFPRAGGMEALDASSAPTLVQEFTDAIALLKPEDGSTDIGRALHFGAQILNTHGLPANDRLMVLISDGAHWRPESEEATGREVAAIEEPVSLMEHFRREMKISLHAIGISSEKIFNAWYPTQAAYRGRDPDIWAIPNHMLLENLVAVGGGDPSRTGDANVLEEYFSGLGTGVTRRVSVPRDRSAPVPAPDELASGRSAQVNTAHLDLLTSQIRLSADELIELRRSCNRYSELEARTALFATSEKSRRAEDLIGNSVRNRVEFETFIINLHCFLAEPAKNTRVQDETVTRWFRDQRWLELNAMRVLAAHDTTMDPQSSNHNIAAGAMLRHAGGDLWREDDALVWRRIQASVLRDCCDILSSIAKTYLAPGRAHSTAAAASPKAAASRIPFRD